MPERLDYYTAEPAPRRSWFTAASFGIFLLGVASYWVDFKYDPPSMSIPPNYAWRQGWGRAWGLLMMVVHLGGVVYGAVGTSRSDDKGSPITGLVLNGIAMFIRCVAIVTS